MITVDHSVEITALIDKKVHHLWLTTECDRDVFDNVVEIITECGKHYCLVMTHPYYFYEVIGAINE